MRRIRARYGREMCSGFTLVEMLVVVAVIAILLAMMLPNIAGQIERARILACRNNMKSIAQVFLIDAGGAGGRVRIDRWQGTGGWAWDIDRDTRDRLVGHGLSRNTFYCPSNREQSELWNFNGYVVTGYWLLIQRNDDVDNRENRYQPHTDFERGFVGQAGDGGSRRVMIADGTIARNNNFTHIYGGWRLPHRSPHLDTDGRPTGGNVLFADGHAVWRNFVDMRSRLTWGPQAWW